MNTVGSSTQLLPTAPFARLKLSSTAVCGKTGGLLTEIATLAVSVPPWPSLTVRIAAKLPTAYVWLVSRPVAVPPSPNVHE